MKRSTCKVLLGIGVFLLIVSLFIALNLSKTTIFGGKTIYYSMSFSEAFFKIPLVYIAAILIIFAWAKWNSEEEYKDIKEAQLHALRRGKVSVELKGKMRKLK